MKDDWIKFEKNNVKITPSVLYSGKQVILSMISDGEKWHYLAVKKL